MTETYEVGELTQEGIYIGRLKSEDGTEKDYFAAPADAQDESGKRLCLNFNEAAKYAKKATDLGHNDWVVPTGHADESGAPDVLNALFKNRNIGAFEGTFDETGWFPNACYWSSSSLKLFRDFANVQRFSDGFKIAHEKKLKLSVRLVRSKNVY